MQVTLELPEDLALLLGTTSEGLSQVALKALAMEGLRAGKLSVAQARRLLGITSRYEMDGFLKAHGMMLPMTVEELEADMQTALAFRNR